MPLASVHVLVHVLTLGIYAQIICHDEPDGESNPGHRTNITYLYTNLAIIKAPHFSTRDAYRCLTLNFRPFITSLPL